MNVRDALRWWLAGWGQKKESLVGWGPLAEREGRSSLYMRPFCSALEAEVGVHPSSKDPFVIILSPVDNYYEKGLSPVSIKIEENDVRAVLGERVASNVVGTTREASWPKAKRRKKASIRYWDWMGFIGD